MKNNPEYQLITEKILTAIARDEVLIEQFGQAVGVEQDVFEKYLDEAEIRIVAKSTRQGKID